MPDTLSISQVRQVLLPRLSKLQHQRLFKLCMLLPHLVHVVFKRDIIFQVLVELVFEVEAFCGDPEGLLE